MREIKFRAWDPDMQSMSPVNPLISWIYDMTVALSEHDEKHPPEGYLEKLIFMQFTGLKDKNGKEIYEGDILQPLYNKMYAFEVKFKDGAFSCAGYALDDCEVIGNMCENPDLLPGSNKEKRKV